MKFAFSLALKNIKRKPFRAAAMSALAMLLSAALFLGAFTIVCLRRGLAGYEARLGADIIVTPNSAKGHGTVDDILLQGITGTYYINGRDIDKINSIEGIETVTKQFFLTSAKASCCSSRVQIIGFDPETDFSVMPWISESYSGTVGDGDIVIGANVSMPADGVIKFYGESYRVAAQLAQTGTGLDSAVYTNMNTIRQMAKNASDLLDSDPFKGVNVSTAASAVLIKVKAGYEITDVADDINIHITKVQATAARSMVSDIASGLSGVSKMIGVLAAVIWALSMVILIIVFAMLSNERRKEFAVLRVMGASKSMLFMQMCSESAAVSIIGSAMGIVIALAMISPISQTLAAHLDLPFLMPTGAHLAVLAAGTLALCVISGVMTAAFSARRITSGETALLLKGDS